MPSGIYKRNYSKIYTKERADKISASLRQRIKLLGYHISPETRKKMSEAKKGKPQTDWNVDLIKRGQSISKAKKGVPHLNQRGENHVNWKGGVSSIKGYHSFMSRKYHLKRKLNGGVHTFQQWEELKKIYNYMCLCCKRFEPEVQITEDHIVPISLGGTDDIENIQPLCHSCNSRKWASTVNFIEHKVSLISNSI